MQCAKKFAVVLFRNHYKNIEKIQTWNINTKQIYTSHKLLEFHEFDKRSRYDTGLEISNSRTERIRMGLKQLKKEIKLWKQEIAEALESDPIIDYRAGIIYIKCNIY